MTHGNKYSGEATCAKTCGKCGKLMIINRISTILHQTAKEGSAVFVTKTARFVTAFTCYGNEKYGAVMSRF